MKDYSKITVHRGPTGNASGYRQNLEHLAQAGHAVRVMSVDTYGPILEGFKIADQFDVPMIGVYRPTAEGQNGGSKDWNYGNPYPWNTPGHNYSMDVETATANHIWAYQQHLKRIPEWREGTWFLFWNEIDHEKLEYASQVALGLAEYAVQTGQQFAFFGLNAGEPEPDEWLKPHTAAFLRYASHHPQHVALALHEYSFHEQIDHQFGWKIGRFKHLETACDKLRIDFSQLRIFLTEVGHGKDATVAPDNWVPTADFLAEVYGAYPNIEMVALWAISNNEMWDGERLSAMVRPAFNHAVSRAREQQPIVAQYDEVSGGQTPKPENPKRHKAVVLKVPQEVTKETWLQAADYAYRYRHTMTASTDDMRTVMLVGNDRSVVKLVGPTLPSQQEAIQVCNEYGFDWLDVTDDVLPWPKKETTPQPQPKLGGRHDLAAYIMPDGVRQYMIKNDGGAQEKYRPQPFRAGHLIQKNGQGEYYEMDDRYIYLVWDTTPNDSEFYRRTTVKGSDQRSPYLPRFMSVGQRWKHDTTHYVTFYTKADCHNANSPYEGSVVQTADLLAHHPVFETPMGAVVNDVLVVSTGPEKQYYAKGIGRIGWESPWGNAWMTDEDVSHQGAHPLDLPTCLR